MNRSLLTFISLLIAASLSWAQSYHPSVSKQLDKIDRSVELVQTFQDFGVKAVGSLPSAQTAKWLVNEYTSYGYDSIRVDSFTANSKMYRNVVVTKQGLGNEYLLICGHYDTRNGPGANDNGSGIAAILEIARILQSLETHRSIIFINFDGEEEGYTGSQYYVNQQLSGLNDQLYLVLNIDQIGGTRGIGGNDRIKCERDEYSNPSSNNGLSWLITDTLAELARIYTDLTPVITEAFSSDYIPFEEQGEVIVGLYQNADDTYSHRPSDTVGNMDTVSFKQAVRLAVAATIHFGQVVRFISIPIAPELNAQIYPNPANKSIHINLPNRGNNTLVFNLLDQSGKVVFSKILNNDNNVIGLHDVTPGFYVVELMDQAGYRSRKPLLVYH